MKVMATTLLGLTLCAPVWASIDMSTMHGVNEGCELRSKATQGKEHISAVDWFNIGRVEGYISGYAEATPGVHLPETVGELHDAACRYIDLHPEIWNLPSYKGLGLVLHTLYGEKK
jgi:hypothetical protein